MQPIFALIPYIVGALLWLMGGVATAYWLLTAPNKELPSDLATDAAIYNRRFEVRGNRAFWVMCLALWPLLAFANACGWITHERNS